MTASQVTQWTNKNLPIRSSGPGNGMGLDLGKMDGWMVDKKALIRPKSSGGQAG